MLRTRNVFLVDQATDDAADAAAAAVGLLNFNQTIAVSESRVPVDNLMPLRNLVEPVNEENRLIVVFVSMVGVNWWVRKVQIANAPFLWDEDP